MNLTIGVAAAHLDAEERYAHLARHTGCKLIFFYGEPKFLPVLTAEMTEKASLDAAVSIGLSAAVLETRLGVPVFSARPGRYDIFRALHRASSLEGPILFMEKPSRPIAEDVAHVARALNINVACETFLSSAQMIARLHEPGVAANCVLVTESPSALARAKNCGMPHVPLVPGEEAFRTTLETIMAVFAERRRESRRTRWLNAVLDHSPEGVAVVDNEGVVVMMNDAALQYARMQRADVVGAHVGSIEGVKLFPPLFSKDANEIAVVKHGGTDLVARRRELRENGAPLGAMYTINHLEDIQRLELDARKKTQEHGFTATATFAHIRGRGKAFSAIKATAKKYAESGANILLSGESGSGKEIFAQSIHNHGPFSDGPFVAINCTVLADSLLESELFGYEDGAFTGARKGGKPGLFELAHKGTLFLDEIGDMPSHTQVKLLRVLQERTVRRTGGSRNIPVDVRFIFATNKDLKAETARGSFRNDLYHRINVLPLHLPPLRAHKEDIEEIALNLLSKFTKRGSSFCALSQKDVALLQLYDWPGNVRELSNFLERAVILAGIGGAPFSAVIEHSVNELLTAEAPDPSALSEQDCLVVRRAPLHEMENDIIRQTCLRYGGDKRQVERVLQISASTLWRRLREISAPPPMPK